MDDNVKKSKNYRLIIIMTVSVLILCLMLMYFSELSLTIGAGAVAIFSAVIGVVLTVVVTQSLLNKQTENEESKEKSVKVFEEKLIIYKEFLAKLHEIIKDGKITDQEVKELIFQISYVAMHTSSERVNKVLTQIKQTINGLDSQERAYEHLAQNVLDMVLVLQEELYSQKLGEEPVDTSTFEDLVSVIESSSEDVVNLPTSQLNENIVIQTYFWAELNRQLALLNPDYVSNWKDDDILKDVTEYYARTRNRHRYYGLSFEVYKSVVTGRKVEFVVEIENNYYYGFAWADKPNSSDDLSRITKSVSSRYKSNEWWGGWRWPSMMLNFWGMGSPEFARLRDEKQRDELIKEIAKEMYADIQKFIEIANQNQL